MTIDELAKKRNAEWNGDPADYPWFEPSPQLAAAFESGDLNDVLPDGTTRRELLGYFEYLEQMDYLKAIPHEVHQYRARLRQEIDDSQNTGVHAAASETLAF